MTDNRRDRVPAIEHKSMFRSRWNSATALVGLVLGWPAVPAAAQVRGDEEVICFPTAATLSDDGSKWSIPIHGWIYEPERGAIVRGLFVDELRDELDLELDDEQQAIYEERIAWFLVDNERGKDLQIVLGENTYDMPPSEENGHFGNTLSLSREEVNRLAIDGRLTWHVVLPDDDRRVFAGVVHLIEPIGLTIISDVDDTVKISDVTDRRKLLRNTFVEPFAAVDGMAVLYRQWVNRGAQLHFVSSSPWQLYRPLSEFLIESGFPDAVWHMKEIRLKDGTVLRLLADPFESKVTTIDGILSAAQERRYVLIGDSGEQDPEVYGEIARRHPQQVVGILVRNVTDETPESDRMKAAFDDVPGNLWQLFDDPAEIAAKFRSQSSE